MSRSVPVGREGRTPARQVLRQRRDRDAVVIVTSNVPCCQMTDLAGFVLRLGDSDDPAVPVERPCDRHLGGRNAVLFADARQRGIARRPDLGPVGHVP